MLGKIFNSGFVANVRSQGQKPIILMVREEFLQKIDEAMPRLGFNDRSSLIREAVYLMLKEAKIPVTPQDKTAPGRAGKGGRPKTGTDQVTRDQKKRESA